MNRLLRRLCYLLQRDLNERELDDELRFHLEMKRQELQARGLDRAAAAVAARRALGNLPLTRDHVRDVWIAPWLQSVIQDVRFAGRLLVKQRGFTLGVVLVLGVGIALTSAMYTVANAILFTGLPGDDDGRIVSLGTRDELGRPAGVSLPDFEDWRDANETFDGIAAMFPIGLNVSDDETAAGFVFGAYISHDAFRLLRTSPVLGRDFLPADDVDGAPGTAILSHRLWMSRYGGNPEVIGRTIRLNDQRSVLIGVMPEGFEFPHSIAIWTPLGPRFGRSPQGRDARTHQAFGRLADGVSLSQAQADLDVVAARLAEEYPETNAGIRPTAVPFTEPFADDWVRRLLAALLGGSDLRAPDCVRERGQSAALALGAPGPRDEPPPVARGHTLAARPAVAARDPPADGACRSRRHRVVRPRRSAGDDAPRHRAVLDRLHDGRARAGARRRHLPGDGPRLRSRAGPAGVEDERERPAEGRRPRRGRCRRLPPLDDRPVDR